MKRLLCAMVVVPVLAGCSEPVFVPEAGPNAPGFRRLAPPRPPDVQVVEGPQTGRPTAGGALDSVVRLDGSFEVVGWALLDRRSPRGVVQVVVPDGVDAQVSEVIPVSRPDVVSALDDDDLLWSGFSVTLSGSLPEGAEVCVLSRSRQGSFRLGGSDEKLCPSP